ncbi:MAG: YveK family protein [Saccharofermentanales bacterium]|jgi:capsular polysaccharide biosynthesis protein
MELSILDILSILLKRMWIILISAVVGLSGAFIISAFLIAPTYTSSCVMYVNPNQGEQDQAGTYNELQYAQKLVNSYLVILQNSVFLDQVAEKSGLGYSAVQIRDMISLSSINNTEFFEVKIAAPSAQDAYELVGKIAELAPAEITRIKETDSAKIVSPAVLPLAPSAPSILLNAVIGAMIGLIVAASAAILIEVLDTRVKSEDDLSRHYSLPILGSIPKYED